MIEASKLPADVRAIYPDGADVHRKYPVSEDGIVFEAFKDGVVTVDKLLDYVDLTLDWYVPSINAIEFIMFIRLVLGEEPENSNPKPHYFLVDCIFQSPNVVPFFMARGIDFDGLVGETVVLCSREFGKSLIMTYLILFMADRGELEHFGKINYGLYVSDSMRNGVKKMMGRINSLYNESPYLRSRFEEVHITQEEATFIRPPRSKRERALYDEYVVKQGLRPSQVPGRMKRTFRVDGLGASTSSRGASHGLTRPQFVFGDDMVANEVDASSKIIMDSIESTIEADIRGGLSGSGYFMVIIGTPYNKVDPVYKRVEEGLMLPVVFPRAATMPVAGLKEDEFESVWIDRHTYKKCKKEYTNAKKAQNNGDSYKMRKLTQEHYLRIANEEERLIKEDSLQWFSRQAMMKNIGYYNIYFTTDYTASNELNGDFSCIAVWAVGNNEDWFLMDLVVKKMTIDEQFEKTIGMVQQWGKKGAHITVGVETDGQQQQSIHSLRKLQVEKNIFFTFASQIGERPDKEGINRRRAGGDKHSQFMRTHSLFQNHKIFFAEELKDTPYMEELLEELKYVTWSDITSKHDDAIDVISMITAMNVSYPSVGGSNKDEDNFASTNDPIWGSIDDDSDTTRGSTIF
jgi:predicted phage terminase large subunit-like protein